MKSNHYERKVLTEFSVVQAIQLLLINMEFPTHGVQALTTKQVMVSTMLTSLLLDESVLSILKERISSRFLVESNSH